MTRAPLPESACSEPLAYWRYARVSAGYALVSRGKLRNLRTAIPVDDPLWGAAHEGEPAAAVAVALRSGDLVSPDLHMSALLIAALDGNSAAVVVFEHLRNRFLLPSDRWTVSPEHGAQK